MQYEHNHCKLVKINETRKHLRFIIRWDRLQYTIKHLVRYTCINERMPQTHIRCPATCLASYVDIFVDLAVQEPPPPIPTDLVIIHQTFPLKSLRLPSIVCIYSKYSKHRYKIHMQMDAVCIPSTIVHEMVRKKLIHGLSRLPCIVFVNVSYQK